jgi:hypothetical protein
VPGYANKFKWWSGEKYLKMVRNTSAREIVSDMSGLLPLTIMSPDGQTDWTTAVWWIHYQIDSQMPFTHDVMSRMDECLVQRYPLPSTILSLTDANATHAGLTALLGQLRADDTHTLAARITAPVTTVYLADQLSIVLAFVEHFFLHTPKLPHHVIRINVLLNSCINASREPEQCMHNDMLQFLKVALSQIRAVDRDNPSLQKTPAYQHQYQRIIGTLTSVIHLGKMHKLLITDANATHAGLTALLGQLRADDTHTLAAPYAVGRSWGAWWHGIDAAWHTRLALECNTLSAAVDFSHDLQELAVTLTNVVKAQYSAGGTRDETYLHYSHTIQAVLHKWAPVEAPLRRFIARTPTPPPVDRQRAKFVLATMTTYENANRREHAQPASAVISPAHLNPAPARMPDARSVAPWSRGGRSL